MTREPLSAKPGGMLPTGPDRVSNSEGIQARLIAIYNRLYNYFGPRHWWPADTSFEVIVGAILTQNVAWKNVEQAIANLKAAGLLDPEAMYRATTAELEPHIRPAGYFRTKAKKLKAFVEHLWKRYNGSLTAMFSRPLAELRPEILAIYGIGPETADAILCYAGNYPIMVMDAYTRRVFSRLGFFDEKITYQGMQEFFMANLPQDQYLYNEYHALIDGLANQLCRKNRPDCSKCPLGDICPRLGVNL
ncbi:ultraviolet N-glycosylase/AP lyase [Moorella mulderi DSM 14980]|uniref:Ultraviolet N-glycosylase/AP lyase n=2 Tax=Neomoorella TaxID=44260 RepID=A0A151AS83_9FIRM|nr:ultraviolet N-glycosylase/AP lyase [Moorella mulderi DSM 14980]